MNEIYHPLKQKLCFTVRTHKSTIYHQPYWQFFVGFKEIGKSFSTRLAVCCGIIPTGLRNMSGFGPDVIAVSSQFYSLICQDD